MLANGGEGLMSETDNERGAPWSAAAREWVAEFREYLSERAHYRLWKGRSGELKALTTPEWWSTYKKLEEQADLLEIDLRALLGRPLPPKARAEFRAVSEPLAELHFAIHDVLYDGDPHRRYQDDRTWITERFSDERATGRNISGPCPAPGCQERFETAAELRAHFSHHRFYQDEDLLLHVGKHRARVLKALKPCRELLLNLDAFLGSLNSGLDELDAGSDGRATSTNEAPELPVSRKRPGRKPHPWRTEILAEYRRRKSDGRTQELRGVEAERLVDWAQQHAKLLPEAKHPPSTRTVETWMHAADQPL